MFQKVLTYITCAIFLISSQMSIVHALFMQDMMDHGTHEHTMGVTEYSIFCKSTSDTNTPECLKEVSGESIVPMKRGLDTAKKTNNLYTPLLVVNLARNSREISAGYIPIFSREIIDKQSYSSLVGIIKKNT